MKLAEIHREIDLLITKIDKLCHSPAAKSSDEANAWTQDPKIHYQEKMKHVDSLPVALEEEVLNITNFWMEYQNRIVNEIDEFQSKIEHIDHLINSKEKWVKGYYLSGLFSEGSVRHIGHVELFAWQVAKCCTERS